jgi:hypothetical protein
MSVVREGSDLTEAFETSLVDGETLLFSQRRKMDEYQVRMHIYVPTVVCRIDGRSHRSSILEGVSVHSRVA